MRYIGLDLHKHSLEVCALDGKGKRLFRQSVACDRADLGEFGRKHLAMLTQAAQHAASHPGPIGAFFRRLRKRKSHNVAVVAVARKLVPIAYLILKNNEPYRYAKPETVRAKLNEVRRKAGEEPPKKKPGKAAVPEPDAGRLNATYRRSGLPVAKTPDEWSAGERRGHGDPDVTAFAEGVHTRPPVKLRAKRAKATAK